jgi:hypothetical protein
MTFGSAAHLQHCAQISYQFLSSSMSGYTSVEVCERVGTRNRRSGRAGNTGVHIIDAQINFRNDLEPASFPTSSSARIYYLDQTNFLALLVPSPKCNTSYGFVCFLYVFLLPI